MKIGTAQSLSNLLNRKILHPRHLGLESLEHKVPGQKHHWKERMVFCTNRHSLPIRVRAYMGLSSGSQPTPLNIHIDSLKLMCPRSLWNSIPFLTQVASLGKRQCSVGQVKMLTGDRGQVGNSASQPVNKYQDWQQDSVLTISSGSNFSIQQVP